MMENQAVVYALRKQLNYLASSSLSARSTVMELEPQVEQAKEGIRSCQDGAKQIMDFASQQGFDLDLIVTESTRYAFAELCEALPVRISAQPL